MRTVNLSPEVEAFLSTNPVVAIGVSGGRDSHACALAVHRHLESIGFAGQKVMIHADLGRVEWQQSLPKCQELADSLGWELMVVRRNAGDMMDRWLTRWNNNVTRYQDLSCVQLILPWSTPGMRFCTSEMKTVIIRSNLKRRFPGQNIVNITGIRRQESANRAKMPLFKEDPLLGSKSTEALHWNAIIDWPMEDVMAECGSHSVALHEGYTTYNMSRISCTYCIMGSGPDLAASASCTDNHDIYREMVDLEICSGFSFQSSRWLGDVAPHILTEAALIGLERAKKVAKERAAIEAKIPKSMLYEKGWPIRLPTADEASHLAEIRTAVSEMQNFKSQFLTGPEVMERYSELLAIKELKNPTQELIPAYQIPVFPTLQMGLGF